MNEKEFFSMGALQLQQYCSDLYKWQTNLFIQIIKKNFYSNPSFLLSIIQHDPCMFLTQLELATPQPSQFIIELLTFMKLNNLKIPQLAQPEPVTTQYLILQFIETNKFATSDSFIEFLIFIVSSLKGTSYSLQNLFEAQYQSKPTSKLVAQYFMNFSNLGCPTPTTPTTLPQLELLLQTRFGSEYLQQNLGSQNILECIQQKNMKILKEIFALMTLSQVQSAYRQMAQLLMEDNQYDFTFLLMALFELRKDKMVIQLLVISYLKKQMEQFPILESESEFYLEVWLKKGTISMSKIQRLFRELVAIGLIKFDEEKLEFYYNKNLFWKLLSEMEMDKFLRATFLINEKQASELLIQSLACPELQHYSHTFHKSNLEVFIIDKSKFHDVQYSKWIVKALNVVIADQSHPSNPNFQFHFVYIYATFMLLQKLAICHFVIQCLYQKPSDELIYQFLHNFFICNRNVMVRFVLEVISFSYLSLRQGFSINYIHPLIENVEAFHYCLQQQQIEMLVGQHRKREFISIFYVELIKKYKINVSREAAQYLAQTIQNEWYPEESTRMQLKLKEILSKLSQVCPEVIKVNLLQGTSEKKSRAVIQLF